LKANYHSSSSCVFCILPFASDAQTTFAALQFAHPMTQKSLNLVKFFKKKVTELKKN
jgi:hypothetical protein